MNPHLETSELSEWALGFSTQQVSRHVQSCATCRTEANALREAIGGFRESVHAEAERDANFWSRQRAGIRERVNARRPVSLLRSVSLAATALVLGAVLLLTPSPQISPSTNNDAADDALLQQVDSDVRQGFPTALGPAVLISQERNSALLANTEGNSSFSNPNQNKEQ
jgi:anti-sigma factor RsiW